MPIPKHIADAFLKYATDRSAPELTNDMLRVLYQPFNAFIGTHSIFHDQCASNWIGSWRPGDKDVALDGDFTAAQLRALADYMDNNS
jgi:hypothetical protein